MMNLRRIGRSITDAEVGSGSIKKLLVVNSLLPKFVML
jgi:hypothetical protein